MKYYKIIYHTPYCGEENTYYFKTDSSIELAKFIDEYVIKKANEWYDEQAEEDYSEWEKYYANCGYIWELITKEEYEDECPWDKED
jgi:hypothetical protein